MVDVTDVRFVDPHAESDRGDDDAIFGRQEPLLNLAPSIGLHTRMISPGWKTVRSEPLGNGFRRFLNGDIDQRRPTVPRFNPLSQSVVLLVAMQHTTTKLQIVPKERCLNRIFGLN